MIRIRQTDLIQKQPIPFDILFMPFGAHLLDKITFAYVHVKPPMVLRSSKLSRKCGGSINE